jgi:outer membrane protein assembly factor BamB
VTYNNFLKSIIVILSFTIFSCSKKTSDLSKAHNVLINSGDVLAIDNILADKFFLPNLESDQFNNSLLSGNIGNIFYQKDKKDKYRKKSIKLSRAKSKLPFFVEIEIINNIIYYYDFKSNLIAYDLEKKLPLWKLTLEDKHEEYNLLKGGVTYYKGKLFVTIGSNFLYVIDAKQGDLLWKKNLGFISRSKPFISDDIVYVNTISNKILAYNIANKNRIWIQEFLSKDSSQYGSASFVEKNGILVTGNSNGDLILLDKIEGKVLWQDNLGDINPESESYDFSDINTTPVLYEDDIFAISSSGYLASYKLLSGIKNWDIKISSVNNRPWITKDLSFVIDKNYNLIAISTKSGKVKWVEKLKPYIKDKDNSFFYGPIIAGNKLFVTSNKGRILTFNFNNGELINKIKIPKNINHQAVIINNKIYLSDNKGKIYIIE